MTYTPPITPQQCRKLVNFLLAGHGKGNGLYYIGANVIRSVLEINPEVMKEMPFFVSSTALAEGGFGRIGYVLDSAKFDDYVGKFWPSQEGSRPMGKGR